MALTKVNRGGLNTGIADSSNATFLTATSAEGVTLAGTLAVTGVHTVGSNAVATSEGGAATTSIVQGLAKTWGTVVSQATVDSFNNSSDTDAGAGQFEHNFTSNFSAANYSSVAANGAAPSIVTFTGTNWYESAHYTTSLSRSGFYNNGTSAYTDSDFSVARFGDLA